MNTIRTTISFEVIPCHRKSQKLKETARSAGKLLESFCVQSDQIVEQGIKRETYRNSIFHVLLYSQRRESLSCRHEVSAMSLGCILERRILELKVDGSEAKDGGKPTSVMRTCCSLSTSINWLL